MKPVPKSTKKKKKKRKKLPSYKSLMKKADTVFAKFIRDRDAVDLNGRCCTCGGLGNQAGHFVKRGHMATRFDPRNCHLQDVRCNHFLDGNEGEYAKFIIEKYGIEVFNELLSKKHEVRKFTREELNKIIEVYS